MWLKDLLNKVHSTKFKAQSRDSQVQPSNGGLKKHKPRKVICHWSPSIAEFTTSLYGRKVLWEVVARELSTLLDFVLVLYSAGQKYRWLIFLVVAVVRSQKIRIFDGR